jgi:hypothetical protein
LKYVEQLAMRRTRTGNQAATDPITALKWRGFADCGEISHI